jgi:cytidylate kinase
MSIASSRPSSQVADCFPARQIHLIGGASGVGKTSVACHLLHAAAHSGGHFFGMTFHDVARDEERDANLAASGISTLRFSNSEIMQDIDNCLIAITTTAGRLETQVSHQASAQRAPP